MGYKINFKIIGDKPPFIVTLHENDTNTSPVLTKTITTSDTMESFIDGGGYTISPFKEYCIKAVDSINKNVFVCDVEYPIQNLTILTNQSNVNVKYLNINESISNNKSYNIPRLENVLLTTTPPQGYTFKNWETTPNTILNNSTDNPLNFSMLNTNFSIKPINEDNSNAFIFTIDTTKGSNFNFTLPLKEGFHYDFTVDWGDGNTNTITSWDDIEKTHEYTTGGLFQVSITGLCESINFMYGTASKLISVDQWGDVGFINMNQAFFSCVNLTSIYDNNNTWSSNVVDMSGMFFQCGNLTYVNINNWDVSNVQSMNSMFYSCSKLTNINLNNWDVSNVTDMRTMFYQCPLLLNINNSNWNVSNVTNMSGMFEGCVSLSELDLTSWNVSGVTNMRNLFYNCVELNVLGLENWNISNVTNMTNILHNVTLETPYYDSIIINWASSTPQNDVVFDANLCRRSSISCNAYFTLINDYNWTINDYSVTNFCTPDLLMEYNPGTNMVMYSVRMPYEGENAFIKLTLKDGVENYTIPITLENYYSADEFYLIPTPGTYIITLHSDEYGEYPVSQQDVDIYP